MKNVHDRVTTALNEIKKQCFTPDVELTFVMRRPGDDECFMVISNDNLEELADLLHRQHKVNLPVCPDCAGGGFVDDRIRAERDMMIRDELMVRRLRGDRINRPPIWDELGVSVRVQNVLMNAKVDTFEKFMALTQTEVRKMRNAGWKTWKEIAEVQAEYRYPAPPSTRRSPMNAEEMLSKLWCRRHEEVVRKKLGIGCEPMTFHAIGKELWNETFKRPGVTTERVRQMFIKAVRSLSHPSMSKRLHRASDTASIKLRKALESDGWYPMEDIAKLEDKRLEEAEQWEKQNR